MKYHFKSWIVSLLMVCLLASAVEAAPQKEASSEARNAAALAKLKSEPNTVSLYAKGACCPSCAIGIRIKISKLDFVDRKRFSKGVAIEPKFELVDVAIKPDHTADIAELTKAITDAGYDPVSAYSLQGGKLKTTSLSKP